MKNKQALLFAITKALSERSESVKERLLKLEFGCWVKPNGYCNIFQMIEEPKEYMELHTSEEIADIPYSEIMSDESEPIGEILKKEDFIILGKMPQWSDIIEVLGKSWYMNRNSIWGTMSVDGSFKFIEIKLSPGYPESQEEYTLEEVLKLIKEVVNG